MSTTPPPPPQPGYGGAPGYGAPGTYVGEQRNIGWQILISIVTLGIYGIYWCYRSQEDIKLHSGQGVGGVVGAIIYFFVGIVTLFLLPIEIKNMYEAEGKESPVSAVTAVWILLFAIPWYVKCQQALNEHWASHGAPPPEGFKI